MKTDKGRGKPAKQEKPSIRAQLRAEKEQTPKKQARQKKGLEGGPIVKNLKMWTYRFP